MALGVAERAGQVAHFGIGTTKWVTGFIITKTLDPLMGFQHSAAEQQHGGERADPRTMAESGKDHLAQGLGLIASARALEGGRTGTEADDNVTTAALLAATLGLRPTPDELIRRGVDRHQAEMVAMLADPMVQLLVAADKAEAERAAMTAAQARIPAQG